MIWIIAALGALLAGLFMWLRQGPELIRARRTGVLIGKSASAPRIERAADPERFEALLRQRGKALLSAYWLMIVGGTLLAWQLLGVYLIVNGYG
ncbi:hypothetical protein QO010_004205 [Caulobacter ginsengisoli]|uniref:Uncharacterized protein n=1 Tax=Caulobacter ginsengisoli TaxID=400775 RepID=A0ABU0IZM2_9CAUL|nr:hypothetical protein [Caulobacter ginsengisoli]MDQ0466412.1 hypothetical protein [Caulobacter ginsengisoli]